MNLTRGKDSVSGCDAAGDNVSGLLWGSYDKPGSGGGLRHHLIHSSWHLVTSCNKPTPGLLWLFVFRARQQWIHSCVLLCVGPAYKQIQERQPLRCGRDFILDVSTNKQSKHRLEYYHLLLSKFHKDIRHQANEGGKTILEPPESWRLKWSFILSIEYLWTRHLYSTVILYFQLSVKRVEWTCVTV